MGRLYKPGNFFFPLGYILIACQTSGPGFNTCLSRPTTGQAFSSATSCILNLTNCVLFVTSMGALLWVSPTKPHPSQTPPKLPRRCCLAWVLAGLMLPVVCRDPPHTTYLALSFCAPQAPLWHCSMLFKPLGLCFNFMVRMQHTPCLGTSLCIVPAGCSFGGPGFYLSCYMSFYTFKTHHLPLNWTAWTDLLRGAETYSIVCCSSAAFSFLIPAFSSCTLAAYTGTF